MADTRKPRGKSKGGPGGDTKALMEYWAHGAGAAKIGWGTPGDMTRCIALLRPKVGDRVVGGLCQNLHKKALGRPNPESGGRK